MEIFKKMGPRVVLVEYRGRVAGLVTVKDCLKYALRSEAGERGGEGERERGEGLERWLWEGLRAVAEWLGRVGKGRIRVRGGEARGPAGILDGTEEVVDEGLELRER